MENPPNTDAVEFAGKNLKDVFFKFDESSLSPNALKNLQSWADFLRQNSDVHIEIAGHCDDRGSSGYNLALGNRRATSVADYLVSIGIEGNRIRTISYGEERPYCTESDEACWQKNRRAHIMITGA